MPERARSLPDILNSDNSAETGIKVLTTSAAAGLDAVVAWTTIETPVWWLKLAGALVIGSPLGLLALYQIVRAYRQEAQENFTREKIAHNSFRLGPR